MSWMTWALCLLIGGMTMSAVTCGATGHWVAMGSFVQSASILLLTLWMRQMGQRVLLLESLTASLMAAVVVKSLRESEIERRFGKSTEAR